MPLVTKLSDACDALVDLFSANIEDLAIGDGGIFYGDQERIPTSPAICVEPNEKRSSLYGGGRMTEVTLSVYVLVYHSEVRSLQDNRRDADKLAEDVTDLLNADATFSGRATHCYVTSVQSGYSTKTNTTMRSSRIVFELTSQERLPQNL